MKKKISRSYIFAKVYPRNKRMSTKVIREKLWDFYALELLKSKCKDSFLEHKRIENLLRETTISLLNEQIMALEASIRGEIRYFTRACHSKTRYSSGCEVPEFIQQVYRKKTPFSLDLVEIESIFHKSIWEDQYGGKHWGTATKTLIEAKKAFADKDLGQMFYVDHIFDLQHNQGFILNKTNFRYIEIDLHRRCYYIKSIKDLKRKHTYISKVVREIIKAA